MSLIDSYLVEKRNILAEMRANNMTLQELRFFSIYLSKINSRDLSTRVVVFLLKDFQRIMDLDKLNIDHLKAMSDSLLSKTIKLPTKNNGFEAFQIFKRFKVDKDEKGSWYVQIDAHDDSLPLMFEFKDNYFKYQLWNVLNLKSTNQLRMYEILKQYEKIGERIIDINELKLMLGLCDKEYPRYTNFKVKVLQACQKALEENTDIKFTFEPYGVKGKSGKILKIKFNIVKNMNYKSPLTLDNFIHNNNGQIVEGEFIEIDSNTNQLQEEYYEVEEEYSKLEDLKIKFKNKKLFFYSEACNHEFNEQELQVLYNIVIKIIPTITRKNEEITIYNYFKAKYDELNLKSTRKPVSNRFGYIKKLIELDLDN